MDEFQDQTRASTHVYIKTRKGKTTVQDRGFHYNSEKITIVTA